MRFFTTIFVPKFGHTCPPLSHMLCTKHWDACDFMDPHQILRNQLGGNVITYSAAISSCEKAAQWQWALLLLDDLLDKKLTGNRITYTSTISACEKGQRWQWAMHFMNEMQSRILKCNSIAYYASKLSIESLFCFPATFHELPLILTLLSVVWHFLWLLFEALNKVREAIAGSGEGLWIAAPVAKGEEHPS